MNTKPVYLLLSFSLMLFSCANNQKASSTDEAQASETVDKYSMSGVMAVHDEVMPKMGEISMLIEQLKPLADKNPGSPFSAAVEELQKSHRAMMDWMSDIGETFTSEEILKGAKLSEEKKARLRIEADRIAEVKQLMLSSIEEGKRLVKAATSE